MKFKSGLVITLGILAFSFQVNAQNSKVQLKDLGVPAQTNNPNRVTGPLSPKPAPAPTIQQNVNRQYQQSQNQAGPTVITKQPSTHPGERSIGVGVKAPLK